MKYIIPTCLVVMTGTQLFDYFINGKFNAIFISIACFLTPSAIKGLKPGYAETEKFKFVSKIFMIIGIIIMFLVILW